MNTVSSQPPAPTTASTYCQIRSMPSVTLAGGCSSFGLLCHRSTSAGSLLRLALVVFLLVRYTLEGLSALEVLAPLVGALVFKTSGRLEESRQWVRFPYTPVIFRALGPISYLWSVTTRLAGRSFDLSPARFQVSRKKPYFLPEWGKQGVVAGPGAAS